MTVGEAGARVGRGALRAAAAGVVTVSAVSRPPVDVVVPFRGDRKELEMVRSRLAALTLREGDTIVVVDNTPGAPEESANGIRVLRAAERTVAAEPR